MTVKISEMSAATTPLTGAEGLEAVQAGNTRRVTARDIALLQRTLAELNTSVTDATLIDTADSRLSDARTPTAHGLGGAEHSADTLANLNSKVSDATLARTDAAQTFTGQQKTGVTALTDAASIAIDASANKGFSVTLGGNRTLANPTNVAANDSWIVVVTQGGAGLHTLYFDTNYVGAGTGVDTSSDVTGSQRVFSFYAISATKIVVVDSLGEAV